MFDKVVSVPTESLNTAQVNLDQKVDGGQSEGSLDAIGATLEAIESLEVLNEVGFENPAEQNSGQSSQTSSKQSQTTNSGVATHSTLMQSLPVPRVMIRKIQTRLNREIKQLIKENKKYRKNLEKGSAYDLNVNLARIRKLRNTLAKLAYATLDYVKAFYIQLFQSSKKQT